MHKNGQLRVRAKATLTFSAACAVHFTIFSTGGKFRPVAIFMLLHALTLVTRSYALLVRVRAMGLGQGYG